ncbi:MAG: hypothetical protein PSY14_00670 [bacterium]|nr:hypothetical protein [bacterium]
MGQVVHKSRKIVLCVAPESEQKLHTFVEECIRGRVGFIAVAGDNCSRIEDIIDELVVGDASDDSRFILTSSHPDEDLDSVIEFARSMITGDEFEDDVEIVKL